MEPAGDRFTPPWGAARRFSIPKSGTAVVTMKFPRSRIIRPDENRPTAQAPSVCSAGSSQGRQNDRDRRAARGRARDSRCRAITFRRNRRATVENRAARSCRGALRARRKTSGRAETTGFSQAQTREAGQECASGVDGSCCNRQPRLGKAPVESRPRRRIRRADVGRTTCRTACGTTCRTAYGTACRTTCLTACGTACRDT